MGLIDKIKYLFDKNNIALTIIVGSALFAIIYSLFAHVAIGAIIMMGVIGVGCYLWGYLRGEEHEKDKRDTDEYEKSRELD